MDLFQTRLRRRCPCNQTTIHTTALYRIYHSFDTPVPSRKKFAFLVHRTQLNLRILKQNKRFFLPNLANPRRISGVSRMPEAEFLLEYLKVQLPLRSTQRSQRDPENRVFLFSYDFSGLQSIWISPQRLGDRFHSRRSIQSDLSSHQL